MLHYNHDVAFRYYIGHYDALFQLNFNCRPMRSYVTIINLTTWLISNLVVLETPLTCM